MKIEEETAEKKAGKETVRFSSIAIKDYPSNYDEIKTYQSFFDAQNKNFHNGNYEINIETDYKMYLDKVYKNYVIRPITRSEYDILIKEIHKEFTDNYVQPLWFNFLKRNLDKVNKIKQNMQAFLQK